MEDRAVTFYFDYISHNAYLAWAQVRQLCQDTHCRLEPVPVLFAALLNAHGQLGPAEIPAKSIWMLRDVVRKAVLLGVPLAPPASHPFNPLLALRISSLPLDREQREALIDGLFRATWAESQDVSDPDIVALVANAVGLDGPALVEQAATAETKQRLHEQSDKAISQGVFGVPSMLVNEELFWGYDDLDHLRQYLDGEDALDRVDFAGWLTVRASSSRRR